jgi:hypothetical protein
MTFVRLSFKQIYIPTVYLETFCPNTTFPAAGGAYFPWCPRARSCAVYQTGPIFWFYVCLKAFQSASCCKPAFQRCGRISGRNIPCFSEEDNGKHGGTTTHCIAAAPAARANQQSAWQLRSSLPFYWSAKSGVFFLCDYAQL